MDRTVSGFVRDDAGIPVPGLLVRAVDRDLRSAEPLGEATTDRDGRFSIGYGAEAGAAVEAGTVDLQVVVPDPNDPGGAPLARSEIRFNAAASETLDLTLPPRFRRPAEVDRYRAQLEPLLGDVHLAELREDETVQDFSFLAGETGIPRERLEWLAAAAAAAARTGLPMEAFYAWFRAGLPTDRLLAAAPGDLMAILERAVAENVVPRSLAKQFDQLRRWLGEQRTRSVLTPSTSDGRATLADVLSLAQRKEALGSAEVAALAGIVAEHPADGRAAAAALAGLRLDGTQRQALRRGLALRRVTGGDPPLMRTVAQRLPALGDGCAELPFAALATLTEGEWAAAVRAADPAADPAAVAGRARAARTEVARLFPHDVLLAPAARRPSRGELADLIGGKSDGATAVAALANAFPGLRLDAVLRAEQSAGDKAGEVDRRLGLLAQVYARNAAVPVLELDYLPGGDAATRLDLGGLEPADRARVLDTFKAMRRVHDVTSDAAVARAVMAAGYRSANQLAGEDPGALARRAGLDAETAGRVSAAATARAEETALYFFGAVEATQGYQVAAAKKGSTATPIGSYFTAIPGYSELFGSLGFCACPHCRSVLSPAAYLVDLLWFVQRRITGPGLGGRPVGYPLRLAVRRPDLWQQPLSCADTETLVPYLDIVNEVLEAHAGRALGAGAGSDVLYRRLATVVGSVHQPFHLHLTRTVRYLALFERTRVEVAETLAADPTTTARASLGASLGEWDLLVRPRAADAAFLIRLFGPAVAGLTATSRLDVADLLRATGWSRGTLGDLLATPAVRGTDQPSIGPERRDANSVQNDIERVGGLTPGVLDRAHRLWRLAQATGLSLPALDLLLATLTPLVPPAGDESARIVALDRLVRLARGLHLPIDAACALVGPVPNAPLEPDERGLFDRLFNLEPFAARQGNWPQALPVDFTHPSFATTGVSTPDNRTLQRLTAGLGVTDAELVSLLGQLGLATPANPSVRVTPEVAALLFRHATLARGLGITIEDLGHLLRLSTVGSVTVGTVRANQIRTLDEVAALVAAYEDWSALGVRLDDARYVIEGVPVTTAHLDATAAAGALTERLARDRPWEFADTVLAGVERVSEDDSRRILAENTAVQPTDDPARWPIERVPASSMLRLRGGIDPNRAGWTLTLPAGYTLPATVSPAALVALLVPFDPLPAVADALATVVDRPVGTLEQLLRIAGPAATPAAPLAAHREAIAAAVYAGSATALRTALLDPRPALLRLAILFRGEGWDTAAVRAVADDRSRPTPVGLVFGAGGVDLSWTAVVESRLYHTIVTDIPAPAADPDAPAPAGPDRAALLRALAGTDWSTPTAAADLAAALAVDPARVVGLRPHLPLAAIARPLRRLQRLRTALRLADALGVSGETLRTIVPPTVAGATAVDAEFTALGQAADALYGVLHTVYPAPDAFAGRLEPVEDAIRGRRRDALVDFLLHPGGAPVALTFASRSELYGYFLLDTEMGGCARTSRIVAATQSVQLYVHRVLMGLEGVMWETLTETERDRLLGLIRQEWQWRQHYRVWEANRRIFLFPENYLEPELRDDRTPLFDTIAEDLTQEETTEDSVTAAYSRYLQGFDELAGLRIAGTYHDTEGGDDTLHVFASTSSDPPDYYHRIATGLWTQFEPESGTRAAFGPWRKLGIQIPVPDVTPAVINRRLYAFWTETNTRSLNEVKDGSSTFTGYAHRVTPRFTVALPGGRWSGAQELKLFDAGGTPVVAVRDRLVYDEVTIPGPPNSPATVVRYNFRPELARREGDNRYHYEPQDWYAVPGPTLPYINVDVFSGTDGAGRLTAQVADQHVALDLFRREGRGIAIDPLTVIVDPIDDVICLNGAVLYAHALSHDGYGTASTDPHESAVRIAQAPLTGSVSWQQPLASVTLPARGILVRRTVPRPAVDRLGFDLVVESAGQPMLALAAGGGNHLLRLGTGLQGTLSRRLFERGITGLLATAFQEECVEPDLPVIANTSRIAVEPPPPARGQLDQDGPMGTYLREIWLELPYLIAGQLNAKQRYAAAQRWYHYLFDPTSSGDVADVDRVWRYRGFRGASIASMREALHSEDALRAYRSDPFNMHAIARARPGVHQRAIVMRYVDNLLDWGDALFMEFTRESLNEATMLYVLAADILGPRPAEVGSCFDDGPAPTYADIEGQLGDWSDFVTELELLAPSKYLQWTDEERRLRLDGVLLIDPDNPVARRRQATTPEARAGSLWRNAGGTPIDPAPDRVRVTAPARIAGTSGPVTPPRAAIEADPAGRRPYDDHTVIPFDYAERDPLWWARPGSAVMDRPRPPVFDTLEQVAGARTIFCPPENRDLMAYWDRVEDRLNKIRNCMDITGAHRVPALFAPEIDPLLLARARAAGVALEDVTQPGSGSVPPYRFSFLIERARQYAASVQTFGNALLGALERKDAEELGRLRTVHERNLQRLRSRVLEWEVTAAQDGVDALDRQREAVEYRRGYYAKLSSDGLNENERNQQASRHTASIAHTVASSIAFGQGIAALVPNAGSPFSMNYGGVQISGALGGFVAAVAATASTAEAISASAGLEASFARRRDEWAHQEVLAKRELGTLDKQIAAAKVRVDIANRSLEVHNRSLDQADEVLDLLDAKFTSLGRYTAMATRAHRLYREAFGTALQVARMAERAFAFERGDDGSTALTGGYWDAQEAGLGAADALLVDLFRLEQRFLESNRRSLEVEQSFSLAMLNPRALNALRETGVCEFSVPEAAFDLTYPGHYRRRIKAVRVSIPCVTGPHVNVGATLRLVSSQVRRDPRLADALTDVPLRHTTAVATSSAQSDPGVFELSFRDERYLPFEGAGAISTWQLRLPSAFRTFDYRTISDVILRIGYTAEEDAALRTAVEDALGTVANSLRQRLTTTGLPLMFSCRYDDPNAWNALLDAAPGAPVAFRISARQLTGGLLDWLRGRGLTATQRPRLDLSDAALALVTRGAAARGRPTATIQASLGAGAPAAVTLGATAGASGLYEGAVTGTAQFTGESDQVPVTVVVTAPGNLATAATSPVDPDRLADIVVVLTVKAAVTTAP